jgi:long-chain fatty acid transport protein
MKHFVVILFALVFVIVLSSGLVMAAGFYIPENGTAAMGQGEAVVARGNDPSTVFHNPAGIVQLEGTQFMLGITPIMPSTTFTNEGTEIPPTVSQGLTGTETDTKDQVFLPPHFYFTHTHDNGVGVGLGITSHFGLGTEWPSNWAGRYVSYDVDVKILNINPNIAVQIGDRTRMDSGCWC